MIISLMVYYFLLSLPMAVCDWLPPMVLQLIYSFVYVSIVFFYFNFYIFGRRHIAFLYDIIDGNEDIRFRKIRNRVTF